MKHPVLATSTWVILILFSVITAVVLIISGFGLLWIGFSPKVCDDGCHVLNQAGMILFGFTPYLLLLLTLVAWRYYLRQAFAHALGTVFGVSALYALLTGLLMII